jgi:polyisoprenoid-binding protein YceI
MTPRWKPALAALLAALPLAAPAEPVRYRIDPEHTYPSIEFSHLGISVWRGKFNSTRGEVVLDREARTGSVRIEVDTASIDFGHEGMNEAARSDKFFDVERHPSATYEGTIRFAAGRPAAVEGRVTIMGVTRPLDLEIGLFNCIPHPILKRELCGADAEGELDWSRYGMKMSAWGKGEAGRVRLRIQAEALRAH